MFDVRGWERFQFQLEFEHQTVMNAYCSIVLQIQPKECRVKDYRDM